MNTYIATVEYYDEFDSAMRKDTVIMRAASYAEAAAQIEESFKNTLESIVSFTAISDMALIHLGNGANVDSLIDTIMSENTF